ncbi:hypothetical protein [Metapseudomonas boanensis]|uniref:Uncharacterized protein n=1 Tax=Metapseudomonas boanensis TaxID=2822138 RepID=A0ABS5XG82_9GAMM|nr:hypothetical protein [Pseudomonas boanensis]MBT8766706.1 hypothetical protein [Pseudomonas boanensis]
MTTKKSGDRVFTSVTHSPVIAQFQLLVKSNDGAFPWAQMLNPREMHFVYDMLAAVEADKDFTLTPAQGRFGLRIIHKLELSQSHWAADSAAGPKTGVTSSKKGKGLSPRADAVARRLAKDRLKRAGVTWTKSTPSDLDLVEMLCSIGAIEQTVPRAKAREALITWSQSASAAMKKKRTAQ